MYNYVLVIFLLLRLTLIKMAENYELFSQAAYHTSQSTLFYIRLYANVFPLCHCLSSHDYCYYYYMTDV